uniref:Uncharacterized protein n=1 Tax=Astyanax mexicanus TaxID=7994 RepID=A0A3B1KJW7_ASTMX
FIMIVCAVLLLALSGCFGEVVDDFTHTFRQGNLHEYATLYDTANKIPVYSAYRFDGLMNCRRNESWFIEPQLENRMASPRMESENRSINYQNQAVNADYENSGFHRGHLAPVYHARTQSCSDATFTLTNAAPQNSRFNQGQWRVTEKKVATILTQICSGNSAYIVTGVVPDNNRHIGNRVSIPSHFWTAYCCLNNNRRVISSSGFLGENTNDRVQEIPVRVLDENLTALYHQKFQVFGGHC